MKTAALIADCVRLHSPPSDEYDERSWMVFATNHGLGWHVGPRDRELTGRALADASRLLRPADMAQLVALRTDVQLLRGAGLIELDTSEPAFMIRDRPPKTLIPPSPTQADLAAADAKRARRAIQLAKANVLPTVLDSVSTSALGEVLRDSRRAPAAVHTSNLEQQVVGLAAIYALAVLPGIADYPSDLVLAWRDELADSLNAFRSRIRELLVESSFLEGDREPAAYLMMIGPQLDRDYHELKREARKASLWQTTKERAPASAGIGAGIGLELAIAGHPLLAASALLQGTISQGIVNLAESVRRRADLRKHPLYWNYRIGR